MASNWNKLQQWAQTPTTGKEKLAAWASRPAAPSYPAPAARETAPLTESRFLGTVGTLTTLQGQGETDLVRRGLDSLEGRLTGRQGERLDRALREMGTTIPPTATPKAGQGGTAEEAVLPAFRLRSEMAPIIREQTKKALPKAEEKRADKLREDLALIRQGGGRPDIEDPMAELATLQGQQAARKNAAFEEERRDTLARHQLRTDLDVEGGKEAKLPLLGSLERMEAMDAIRDLQGSPVTAKNKNSLTLWMFPEERDTLLGLAGAGDLEGAEAYYTALKRDLNARQATQEASDLETLAKDHPIVGAGINLSADLLQGGGYLANAGQALINELTGEYVPTDYNSPVFGPSRAAAATGRGIQTAGGEMGGAIGGKIAGEKGKQFGAKAGQMVAGGALSAGQMLAKLPLGPVGGMVGVYGSAAGSNTLDALQRGASPEEALLTSTAAGVAEVLTEKLPFDEWLHLAKVAPSSAKQVLFNTLKSMGSEAGQEMVTELANNVVDRAVMGDRSSYEAYVRELMAGGMDEAAARKAATKQFYINNVLEAGASGALVGGLMAGATQTAGYLANRGARPGTAQGAAHAPVVEPQGPQQGREVVLPPVADGVQDGAPVGQKTGPVVEMPVAGAEKTASTGEAGSTAINTDPAGHTMAEQQTITDYQSAVDSGIVRFVERWRGLKDPNYRKKVRMDIAPIGPRTVRDIKAAIGIDISGFTGHSLSGNALEHTEKRHGANGKADHSMADINDIARMGYVLENYDSVEPLMDSHGQLVLSGEYFNADGSRAPQVRFQKKVDGTYYVVEAVPDSAAKELRVVSAYMSKASGSTDRLLNVPQSGPQLTSKTPDGAYTPAAGITVPQPEQVVKDAGAETAEGQVRTMLAELAEKGGTMDQAAGQVAQLARSAQDPAALGAAYTAMVGDGGEFGIDSAGKIFRRTAEGHIDQRDPSTVGSRKVRAFQFDNPQLHQYFVGAARGMLEDLSNTTRAERWSKEAYRPETGMVETTWDGVKRSTTEGLAWLLDECKLSYKEIEKALQALIQDSGQENYAAAKRVELALDDMLSRGYTDALGRRVEADQGYIEAKGRIPGAEVRQEDGGGMLDDVDPIPAGDGLGNTVGAAQRGFAGDYDRLQLESSAFHPDGERAYRQVDVPKRDFDGRNIPKSAATVMESQTTPDSAVVAIQRAIAQGRFSFDTITDKGAIERGEATIRSKGFDGAREVFHQAAVQGKLSKDTMALGQLLLNSAMNSHDDAATVSILTDYSSMSTTAAQVMQAQRILKTLAPEWQLYTAQKSLETFQETLQKELGDKAPKIQVPQELYDAFVAAADEEARQAALTEIYKNVASQVPATWKDKWNAWRYLSMLGNPRTHVRNIVGNVGFMPVRLLKDAMATAMEAGVDVLSPKGIQRTKAALNPTSKADIDLLRASLADVANVEEALLGGGKYAESALGQIEQYRKIFTLKPLEGARKANTNALDAEDTWFSKPAYAGALAGYLKANGVTAEMMKGGTVEAKLLDKARAYAVKEAQKATYRDVNEFSDFVAGLRVKGNGRVAKGVNVFMEGLLPFRKTPANILVRGVEYSPLGLLKGLTDDLAQVKAGEKTAAEAIDQIAAGMTGTMLMGLGALLAHLGLVSGGASGDDKEDELDELTGGQNYALSVGGKNYTLDWLAPEALPFFVGVEANNVLSEGGSSWKNIGEAISRIGEPMLEMSMLQGVQDAIEAVKFTDVGTLPKVGANAALNYLTQGLPTLFGQIERVGEAQRETTFIDREGGPSNELQRTLGKAMNKLPGEYQQIPYVDAWGRREETGSLPERMVNNFLAPWYTSKEGETEPDREIRRLLDEGQTGVVPQRVPQSFQVTYKDGSKETQKRYLTAEEYVDYATVKGETSFDLVESMIRSDRYRAMTDEERASAISLAYSYAAHVAAEEVEKKHVSAAYVALAQRAQKELGLSEAEYLLLYGQAGANVVNGDGIREAYQAGISPDEYVGYTAELAELESKKKADVVKVIHRQDLSRSEKDALYLEKGYAKSGLGDTPWH